MKYSFLLCGLILSIFFRFAVPLSQAETPSVKNNACAITGITPLKQYLLPKERKCFSTFKTAKKHGFALTKKTNVHRLRPAICNFIGIRGTQTLYTVKDVYCFRNRRRAEQKGYTHFVKGTDVGEPMFYETPTPQATATLSGDRKSLTLGCNYNYPNITELHIHLPPDNTEYCLAPDPTSPVAPYTCSLTPEVAEGIEKGEVFVMIHAGPIGEGEMITAAGYF